MTRLSSTGNSLIYSTYLGGGGVERGLGIAVDASGSAYVTGGTSSTDFPTENPFQTDQGDWDVFICKIDLIATDIMADQNAVLPYRNVLEQNYPNPFNPTTNIKFEVMERTNVKISIYNILGRELLVLINENLSAGYYSVKFNGSDFSNGVYLYKIVAGDFTDSKKMILLK